MFCLGSPASRSPPSPGEVGGERGEGGDNHSALPSHPGAELLLPQSCRPQPRAPPLRPARPSQDEQLADEVPQSIRQQTEDFAKQFLQPEATEEVELVRK